MARKVEWIAARVRADVQRTAEQLEVEHADFLALYAPRLEGLGFRVDSRELAARAARATLAQWLVAYSAGALDLTASLAEAERWFHGDLRDLPKIAPDEVPSLRDSELTTEQIYALLPYLLDPLAPGTRRAVLRDGGAMQVRQARKRRGIYYTPADVANYMAEAIDAGDARTCLDPACGSGVFLRAARTDPQSARPTAFGCDISPAAAEACAFTLLLLDVHRSQLPPWCLWHLHRLNLGTLDSLLLSPGSARDELEQRRRARAVAEARARLIAGESPPHREHQQAPQHLGDLFSDLLEGADVLLCNPPYAPLGKRADVAKIAGSYASFSEKPPSDSTDISPAFIEHAWRLTHHARGRAAVVAPLSVAFSSAPHFRGLRHAIAARKANWRFSFFDRAPDALFGDDIKTRNAVILYDAAKPARIETTAIQRWTSRNRDSLFSSLRHTDVTGADIGELIPKLGSAWQAMLYRALRKNAGTLAELGIDTARPGTLLAPDIAGSRAESVYIASTAYNWLNCARGLQASQASQLSSAGVARFRFRDAHHANAAYALLSSRLVFWLWRVEGDAFHVTRSFLRRLPFGLDAFSPPRLRRLAELGVKLWAAASSEPVISTNKGKRTVAFPAIDATLADAVDEIALDTFAPGVADVSQLRDWYQDLIVLGREKVRRAQPLARSGALAHA